VKKSNTFGLLFSVANLKFCFLAFQTCVLKYERESCRKDKFFLSSNILATIEANLDTVGFAREKKVCNL